LDQYTAREELQLRLHIVDKDYATRKPHGFFEDALIDIRDQLPPDIHVQTCFFCGLSDYHPSGMGLFGGLACFREQKAAYRAVQTKNDLFALWPKKTAFVQETYHCPAFEQRRLNTGYRG
jgi:hypothetical protein